MREPLRWPSGRRLFLMRHGETYEPHPDTVVPGRDENPELPLTPRGRERLAEVGQWMAELPIEAAYASPYRRSQDTAKIVEFIGSGHPWVRAVNATFHDPFKIDAPGL